MKPLEIAAFARGDTGGNPAGVVISDALPPPDRMQAIAAELGHSETVFAARQGDAWQTRYFAPVGEVPFCGHATIALGAALGAQEGAGTFALSLQNDQITVEAHQNAGRWLAALQSPQTWSRPMGDDLLHALLNTFDLTEDDLDHRLPPHITHAGATHGLLVLSSRDRLAQMAYPFEALRTVMALHDLVTVNLVYVEGPRSFVSRNAFASGGVVEDPATGAAAAALGGALVDLDWDGLRAGGQLKVAQGEDMGMPSTLTVDVTGVPGASVRVSGQARWM